MFGDLAPEVLRNLAGRKQGPRMFVMPLLQSTRPTVNGDARNPTGSAESSGQPNRCQTFVFAIAA